MNKYMKSFIKWTVPALCLVPTLSWAHGALDIPASRAVNCQATGGYWQSEDGSSIVDKGCRESATLFGTPAQKVFAAQQWHEVSHIPGINNPSMDQIKAIIKDGQICAANDPRKASLDYPTPYWTKTDVTSGQPLTLRLIGTAPHVPSKFYTFASKPGFNSATDKLKWSDLVQLGQEEIFEVAKTNWQTPPRLPGASGYFETVRTIPNGLSGNGLIVGIWVRDDPNGEFFISCSDVNFTGGGVPEKLHNIGTFINGDMSTLKPGDSVHYRIFGNDGAKKELVDIIHKISAANLPPVQWGKEIADQVNPSIAKIGELEGSIVTYNVQNPLSNSTYATQQGYSQAMSIIAGEGPGPVNPAPPIARITGPTALKSGETFTFSGTTSTGSNGPLLYQWAVPGMTGAQNGATISGKAYQVPEVTTFEARLIVRDQQNGKTDPAKLSFTVEPASGDTDYPQWKPNGGYNSGSQASNYGVKYRCKQGSAGAWCGQNENEPGKPGSTFWQRAWDVVP